MKGSKARRYPAGVCIGLLLGSMAIAGCSSAPQPSSEAAPGGAAPPMADSSNMARQSAEVTAASAAPDLPQAPPQMVKTAEVVLTLPSVKDGIDRVTAIAQQQQGDIVGLQDQTPSDPSERHTALVQLRVPQRNLSDTLKALSTLGTVERQTLSATDVSTQLVDYQARLRNLRNTEAMLLKIMDRSGSVGDVLKVAQEVSNVRNTIEQLDAQLKALQNQVAFSVVTVNLAEAIATIPPQQPVAVQIKDTWEQATHSVGAFTVGLLKLLLWLMVYSPYWLAVAIAAFLVYRRSHRTTTPAAVMPTDPPTPTT